MQGKIKTKSVQSNELYKQMPVICLNTDTSSDKFGKLFVGQIVDVDRGLIRDRITDKITNYILSGIRTLFIEYFDDNTGKIKELPLDFYQWQSVLNNNLIDEIVTFNISDKEDTVLHEHAYLPFEFENIYTEEEVIELLHKRMRFTLGLDYDESTTNEWVKLNLKTYE